MRPSSSGVGRELKLELHRLSRHAFEQRCDQLLQIAYPNANRSRPQGELDSGGIDIWVPSQDCSSLHYCFQCKGFELPEFEESQAAQCINSIATFYNSNRCTHAYYLVSNRHAKGDHRKAVESELSRLVADSRARVAELLDLDSFLILIYNAIKLTLYPQISASLARFTQEHVNRLNEDVIVDKVPFELNGQLHTNEKLIPKLGENIGTIVRLQTEERSWHLILGEFGFGKTSIALRLAEHLQEARISAVYLPIARFGPEAFRSERNLAWEILDVLDSEPNERSTEASRIRVSVLKEILKREKSIILIFDGLDEHPELWEERGLQGLFGSLRTFTVTNIFTARLEFYSDRAGMFAAALRRCPAFSVLKLNEWSTSSVLELINLEISRHPASSIPTGLASFATCVRDERYAELYGDIPLRPLFLKMLIQDAKANILDRTNLAALYEHYFVSKFYSDREGSISNSVSQRPLKSEQDYEQTISQLLAIMTLAAGEMVTLLDGDLQLLPSISESDLLAICKRLSVDEIDTASISINSVLIPIAARNRHRDRGALRLAFAHRSFQEYFLARFLVDLGRNNPPHATSWRGVQLSSPIRRFLASLEQAHHQRPDGPSPLESIQTLGLDVD